MSKTTEKPDFSELLWNPGRRTEKENILINTLFIDEHACLTHANRLSWARWRLRKYKDDIDILEIEKTPLNKKLSAIYTSQHTELSNILKMSTDKRDSAILKFMRKSSAEYDRDRDYSDLISWFFNNGYIQGEKKDGKRPEGNRIKKVRLKLKIFEDYWKIKYGVDAPSEMLEAIRVYFSHEKVRRMIPLETPLEEWIEYIIDAAMRIVNVYINELNQCNNKSNELKQINGQLVQLINPTPFEGNDDQDKPYLVLAKAIYEMSLNIQHNRISGTFKALQNTTNRVDMSSRNELFAKLSFEGLLTYSFDIKLIKKWIEVNVEGSELTTLTKELFAKEPQKPLPP